MKRITFAVSNDIRYDRRMQRICTTLAENGFEVTLVGRKLPDSIALPEFQFRCVRLKCWFTKGKLFYIELNIRLYFYLLKLQSDIFSAVDLDTALPVLWVSRQKGKPSCLDAHEYFPEVPEVERRPIVKWIWKRVEAYVIPRFSAVYTVSQSIADTYTKQFKREISLVRNMPHKVKYEPLPFERRSKVLLYQGALNEGRGLESLLFAMQGVDAELWLAGKGDIEVELRALSVKLGLEKKVSFLGWIAPEDLPKLTQKAFIGLNLLEARSKSYFFSLANKTFDYVQASVPAIHMNFPEYRALFTQYPVGLLVDGLEPQTIRQAIETLLIEENWIACAEACQRASKEWIWEQEEQKLIEIYRKLD
jgi:glycosyltransferase involved in cell wall biosynthesis